MMSNLKKAMEIVTTLAGIVMLMATMGFLGIFAMLATGKVSVLIICMVGGAIMVWMLLGHYIKKWTVNEDFED